MPTIVGSAATSTESAIGSSDFVARLPDSASLAKRSPPRRPSHGNDAALRERLVALSSSRLVDIILDLVAHSDDTLVPAIEMALRRLGDTPAEAPAEETEPFMVGNSP